MNTLFKTLVALLVLVGLVALVQSASQEPGYVAIEWYGYIIETSATFLVAVFNIGLILAFLVGRFLGWLLRLPQMLCLRRTRRSERKALQMVADGWEARRAGDTRKAQSIARSLNKFESSDPDTANAMKILATDISTSQEALHRLLGDDKTAFFGHVGLMDAAAQRADWPGVQFHASAALNHRANSPTVREQYLEAMLHCHKFIAARDALPKTDLKATHGDKADFMEAAIRLQAALQEKADNPTTALRHVQQTTRKVPHFVPGALAQANMLLEMGKPGPAERALATFFHSCPRYDVFRKWLETIRQSQPNLTADKLWKKLDQLLEDKLTHPDHAPIAALCAGTAALDQGDTVKAREYLMNAFRKSANKTVLQKLAELERKLDDEAAAADWLKQAIDAPDLSQPGDEILHAYQDFLSTYQIYQGRKDLPASRQAAPLALT